MRMLRMDGPFPVSLDLKRTEPKDGTHLITSFHLVFSSLFDVLLISLHGKLDLSNFS